MSNKKRTLTYDFIWHFIGMAVPMVVLFVRSPIYTRIFSPEMYGQFALVNVTFFYIATFTFTWIINGSSRYYHKYEKRNKLTDYTITVSNLLLFSVTVVCLVAVAWVCFVDNQLMRKLIIYGAFHFIFQESINVLLIPMKFQKKVVPVNIIRSIAALSAFLLLLGLTFIADLKIESFYFATALINGLVVLFLIVSKKVDFKVCISKGLTTDMKRFLGYGFADWSVSIGVILIVLSDRYLINYFFDSEKLGIYNQMYSLAYTGLYSLVVLYQTTIAPYLLELLEKQPKDYRVYMPKYLLSAVWLYLPFMVLGSLFSKEISIILLGEEFREAWFAMPYVFVSVFVYGITYFYIAPLKMFNKYKVLGIGGLVAGFFNIAINVLLLPKMGYTFAAVTTLISYIFLLIIYYVKFDFRLRDNLKQTKSYAILFAFVLIFIFIDKLVLERIIHLNEILEAIVASVILLGAYFVVTKKAIPDLTLRNIR